MNYGYLKAQRGIRWPGDQNIHKAIRLLLVPVHNLYRIVMVDTVMVNRLVWLVSSRLVAGSDGPSNSDPRPLLQFCYPQGSSSAGSQEEEEAQHGYQLEDHRYGSKPRVLPRPVAAFPLHLLLAQPSQLEPSVVRQLPVPRTGNHEKGNSTTVRYQVEREKDDQLDDLFQAEGLELGLGGGLAQHLDRRGRIREKQTMGRNEIGQSVVY